MSTSVSDGSIDAPLSWALVAERSAAALAGSALAPIATDYLLLHDGGVPFVVRRLTDGVQRKQASSDAAAAGRNPFLPPDPALMVAELSATHRVLLNKYPVLDDHLLIVTSDFVDQRAWLTADDFLALWQALAACDGLAFYNSGHAAGASQPHRHLQLVRLPFVPDVVGVPTAPLITQSVRSSAGIGQVSGWPFAHAIGRFSPDLAADPARAAAETLALYQLLLRHVGIESETDAPFGPPYNLLVTRDWLLIVPRSVGKAHGISVNALGFAGSLFVRGSERLAWLRANGPLALLAAVAVSDH